MTLQRLLTISATIASTATIAPRTTRKLGCGTATVIPSAMTSRDQRRRVRRAASITDASVQDRRMHRAGSPGQAQVRGAHRPSQLAPPAAPVARGEAVSLDVPAPARSWRRRRAPGARRTGPAAGRAAAPTSRAYARRARRSRSPSTSLSSGITSLTSSGDGASMSTWSKSSETERRSSAIAAWPSSAGGLATGPPPASTNSEAASRDSTTVATGGVDLSRRRR